VVLEASMLEAGDRPTAVLISEPVEEFDTGRGPTFPDELPRTSGG
jgi:hypothetical protein